MEAKLGPKADLIKGLSLKLLTCAAGIFLLAYTIYSAQDAVAIRNLSPDPISRAMSDYLMATSAAALCGIIIGLHLVYLSIKNDLNDFTFKNTAIATAIAVALVFCQQSLPGVLLT